MLGSLVDFFPNILLLSSIVPVVRDRIISLLEILCPKQSGCASLSLNIRARTTGDAKAGQLLGRTRLWGAADLLLHLKLQLFAPLLCPYSRFSSSNGTGVTGQYNLASNEISPLSAHNELSFWTHRAGAQMRRTDK